MKKWMLIQRYPTSPVEIWEYIDDLREAMKYWYVARAIQKYGVEKVMPIVMNDMGGYHTHRPDCSDVLAIIESEEKPNVSVFRKYPVNNEHFDTGWLSPECTSFSCHYMGHIRLAMDICRDIYGMPETNIADDVLLGKGWIKVQNGRWLAMWDKINDEQALYIEKKGFKKI